MSATPTSDLRAREVIATALGIYRRRFWLLAPLAVLVFAVLSAVEVALGALVERWLGRDASAPVRMLVLSWGGLWLLGSAVYSGLCDKVVGKSFGHRDVPLGRAVRELPYGRLIGVDLVLAVLVSVASTPLVLPGVLVATLTCLAAPLVNVEDLGVWAAVRRSVQLTHRRIRLTLVTVTLPLYLEHEAIHLLDTLTDLSNVTMFGLYSLGAVVVYAPVVLCEVVLAFTLSHQDGAHRPLP